uniref:Uncharacterized protein n=1 Tax=Rhizophora mucronata TaxID=61149 RepID=A0A2P2P6J4_RHIMU
MHKNGYYVLCQLHQLSVTSHQYWHTLTLIGNPDQVQNAFQLVSDILIIKKRYPPI